MKKTVTVNLNGRVFTMDEDAYQLLDNYLKNLRIYFRKEEGAAEIIADFEARIEELLSEKLRLGIEVINISHIEEVISLMGNPSDFDTEEDEDDNRKEQKTYNDPFVEVKKKFYRNPDDKMLGGVCSGVAAYFGWEVLPVRIIFLLLLFVTSFWFSIFYFVLWLIFPLAKTAEEKLQMRGKPITVENIGKTVAQEAEQEEKKNGFLDGMVRVFVAIFKILLTGILCLIGIPLIFVGIIVIIVVFAALFGIGNGIIFGIDWTSVGLYAEHPTLAVISLSLVILIPIFSIIYSIVSHIAKFKPLHSGVKWTIIIVWIIALITFFASGFKKDGVPWWEFITERDTVFVDGDNTPAERLYSFPAITSVKMDGKLRGRLQIEQREGDETCLFVYTDNNFIDKVSTKILEDGTLRIYSDRYRLRGKDKVRFVLQTPDLNKVRIEGAGDVVFSGAFRSEKMDLKIEGAGNISADSLYVNYLKAQCDGAGDVQLAGKAVKSSFEINGAGDVKAIELESDTVFVNINGAGNVRCNPVKLLDATIQGAGDIRYKEEPHEKKTGIYGAGSIRKQ